MLLRQEVRESALYNSVLNALGAGSVAAAYATGGEALPTYIGKQFESICLQWIQRKNAAGNWRFTCSSSVNGGARIQKRASRWISTS